MIDPDLREAILALHRKGTPIRKIVRLLAISRNSVRGVIRQPPPPPAGVAEPAIPAHLLTPLRETFVRCEGNVVRVQEVLAAEHAIDIPYSTLTRWVREADLRAPKQRAPGDTPSTATHGRGGAGDANAPADTAQRDLWAL